MSPTETYALTHGISGHEHNIWKHSHKKTEMFATLRNEFCHGLAAKADLHLVFSHYVKLLQLTTHIAEVDLAALRQFEIKMFVSLTQPSYIYLLESFCPLVKSS